MNIEYTDSLPIEYDEFWQNFQVVDRRDIDAAFSAAIKREELVKKYAWAVPNDEALQTIAKFSPLVEVGAGTGYWAYELRKRDVEIHPYDIHPADGSEWTDEEIEASYDADDEALPRKNWYHRGHPSWTEVLQGTPDVLKNYSKEWNLMLCWPPMSDMAAYALGYHRGDYLIYIGEGSGGCTGDRMFFRLLARLYDAVESVNIPQWPGLHDYLTVYKRKGR